MENISTEDYFDKLQIPPEFRPVFLDTVPSIFWGLYEGLPMHYWEIFKLKDGAQKFLEKIKEEYADDNIISDNAQKIWQAGALFYRYYQSQYHQAIKIMQALYESMLDYQIANKCWTHKAMPLVFIRDFYMSLSNPVLAKRFMMLALCDDSIRDFQENGRLNKDGGGTYFRLSYYHGMSDQEIDRYAKEIYEIYKKYREQCIYPEWILQEIDNNWMTEYPSPEEVYIYTPNKYYVRHLITLLPSDKDGKVMERIADYILSVIPGFRIYRRKKSETTDYDVICSREGSDLDFRSELGRYIVCECKSWSLPADFTSVAKFSSVLDSVKSNTGLLFSKKGVSGKGKTKFAERALLKLFQKNNITIIVIDEKDLKDIANGENLIVMIRNKYEKIKFDLT